MTALSDPMVPLARRIGTTSGQAWTLVLGLLLAGTLLATSLPPVLERRGQVVPVAAPAPVAPLPGSLTGIVPPAPAPAPAPPAALPVGALPLAPPVALPPAPPLLLPPAAPAPLAAPAAPPAPGPAPAPAPAGTGTASPLTVREAGYSTADPVPSSVPPDAVPVSARLGRERETAYLRLTGGGTLLVLAVAAAEGPTPVAVRACAITDADWTAARPGPAVAVDRGDCVPGTRAPDGTVSFDLTPFGERTGPRGVAVLLDPSVPSQVPATGRLLLRVPPAPEPPR